MPPDNSSALPPLWARANYLAGLCLLLLGVWAVFAEVDETVRGSGRAISSGDNKLVQHLEGGIVAGILVREGEAVEAGQVLFRVRNQNAAASLGEKEVQLRSLALRLLRLRAEIEGTPLEFPNNLRRDYPHIVASERQLYLSRQREREQTRQVFDQQIAQKSRSLEQLTAKAANLRRELATAREQYAIVQKLEKSGEASTNRMLEAQSKMNRLQTELASAEQGIPVTRAERQEAVSRREEALARLSAEAQEELNATALEGRQLKERLKADRDTSVRADITAPVRGIVNRLHVHTIGGIVQPGQTLAEITPTDDNVIVEARIAPEHRAKIWNGQTVHVKVSAFDYSKYGTATGQITDISADTLLDEMTRTPYYRVKVVLTKMPAIGDQRIMPGMMTDVDILTGKRTVMDYLLKPLVETTGEAFREG